MSGAGMSGAGGRTHYGLRAMHGRVRQRWGAGWETGAPGGTRTHDLQVRNLTLYPLSYGRTLPAESGGEGGIRTPDGCYPITV